LSNLPVKPSPTSEFQQLTGRGKVGGNGAVLYLVLAILLFVSSFESGMAIAENTIELDESERAWLKKHSVIRVAPDPDFAPVEWFNDSGNYQGMSSDYIRLLEEKLGVRFEIISVASWKAVLDMARQKKVDVLTALARTPQREVYLNFSQPYLSMNGAIFSNRELPAIRSLTDLKGYRVAVVEGYLWDELLTPYAEDLSLNRFHDLQTALISTSRDVTDVTVGLHVTSLFAIKKEGLHELSLVTTLPQEIDLNFGVRKDWLPLVEILNKALASISPAQHAAIRQVWV
jgi:ABC-type amino acid transport substrate-binding protein